MRQSFFALAALALLLGACAQPTQTSTPPPSSRARDRLPDRRSRRRARRALRCCCRRSPAGRPRSGSRCGRLPRWRCSTPAPGNWRWPPTIRASAETAMEAYRKPAPTGSPRCSAAVRPVGRRSGAAGQPGSVNVISFSNDGRCAARRVGSWASPPRRRFAASSITRSTTASGASPPSRRRRPTASKWFARWRVRVTVRGGQVGDRLYDPNTVDLSAAARRLAGALQGGDGKLAVLVPVAPPPVGGAGRSRRGRHRHQVDPVGRHRRVGRPRHRRRGVAARPGMPRPTRRHGGDFERKVPGDLWPAAQPTGDACL